MELVAWREFIDSFSLGYWNEPVLPKPTISSVALHTLICLEWFEFDDMAVAQKAVLGAGGHAVGEIVTLQTATGAKVTWCYVTDPEGNIIELQAWAA